MFLCPDDNILMIVKRFHSRFRSGDNKDIIATDSQKNTVNVFAKQVQKLLEQTLLL